MRMTRNHVWQQCHRGFESLTLRHFPTPYIAQFARRFTDGMPKSLRTDTKEDKGMIKIKLAYHNDHASLLELGVVNPVVRDKDE